MPSVTGVTTLDVAVIGAGVIGAACARALSLNRLAVGLFDPGPMKGAASPASAGMLAAQIEATDEAWLALATRARDRYPALAQELEGATRLDVGLSRAGIAAMAFDATRAAELQKLAQRHRSAGLRAEWLSAADVSHRWNGAAPGCLGAFFSPDDGAIIPPVLTGALLAHATLLGARLIAERVERISHTGGRVTGLATERHKVVARHVVLAAGAWSSRIAGLPRPLPVTPVRGQLALVRWPTGVPPAILYHDHGYVLKRGADSALVGSTMEYAGFDARVTLEGQATILEGARRLLPSLSGATSAEWAGLRPVTPDGLPIVGPDPELDGLWYATGHGRNGILLAALTADAIADLITTGSTDVDVSLFRPGRFASHPSPQPLTPSP